MTDETKTQAAPEATPEPTPAAAPEAPEPTRDERVATLLTGYEHGMASNAPRTNAELAEIKALLEG